MQVFFKYSYFIRNTSALRELTIYSVTFLFLFILTHNSYSQTKIIKPEEPTTRILFVFDASNSMNGTWQTGDKITIARKLLLNALDSLQYVSNLQLALRPYGHLKYYKQGQDCEDTKLEVPFEFNNADKIKAKLKTIIPKGTTLIAKSLEKSDEDFTPCNNCRNIILLFTDGMEECDGDPCAVSTMLQKKGIILKPFVIGIGLDAGFKKTFECVGNYFDAANEETFRNVLNIVISQALNTTTVQVNLLDKNDKPTETDANMTFYDQYNGKILYNYIHTINNRGNPDTVRIDPIPMYRMTVHTIPPVTKDSIKLIPGKHNIIAVDAPQGYLLLKSGGNIERTYKAIVRKSGDAKTLNVQDFGTSIKYILGDYDLEVLSLPRIHIKDVNIAQSHTTTVEIPQPGIATINFDSPGYASLFVEENNELKWVYNFTDNTLRETLNLQPGSYRIVYRSKAAKEASFTLEKSFKIISGSSVVVKMN